jgi:hypothetical protein
LFCHYDDKYLKEEKIELNYVILAFEARFLMFQQYPNVTHKISIVND